MEEVNKKDYIKVKNNIVKNSIPTIIAFILSDIFLELGGIQCLI